MRSVETMPGMGERKIKENDKGSEFKYILYIVRTFVNATMYPTQQNSTKNEYGKILPYSLSIIQNKKTERQSMCLWLDKWMKTLEPGGDPLPYSHYWGG
jgi:hypothetical protein